MACVFFGNDSKGLALVLLAQYMARIKKTWPWNGSDACYTACFLFLLFFHSANRFSFKEQFLIALHALLTQTRVRHAARKGPSASCKYKTS